MLRCGVSAALSQATDTPLGIKQVHTHIVWHAKSHAKQIDSDGARARQTSPCHRFVSGGRLSLGPSAGITLRAEAIQQLLYELLLYELSFSNGSRVALRVITLRAVAVQ